MAANGNQSRGKMSRKEITDGVIKGIVKASKDYDYMTGGDWLDEAPEYFIVVKIAECLSKIDKPGYIFLEQNEKRTLKDAGALRGKPHKELKDYGRYDLLVAWGADRAPRAIIEVKTRLYSFHENARHDVVNICKALARGNGDSRIDMSVFAFYTSVGETDYPELSPRAAINKRVDSLYQKIAETAEGVKNVKVGDLECKIGIVDNEAWAACCVPFYLAGAQ